eukprot:TRINITY_DN28063_c0_g1_i4.p1 TRINITY_DN28063_c0_g1~~TRINITY_DN28063_c0_g1_i4.p1  ORF type:complete len:520 (+),score=157.86 TRINITY_DN28063_c0_g1_i4:157-1716(+)
MEDAPSEPPAAAQAGSLDIRGALETPTRANDSHAFAVVLHSLLEEGRHFRAVCDVLPDVLALAPVMSKFVVESTVHLGAVGATMASFRVLLDVYAELLRDNSELAPTAQVRQQAKAVLATGSLAPAPCALMVKALQLRQHNDPGLSDEELVAALFVYVDQGDVVGASAFGAGLQLQALVPSQLACEKILAPLIQQGQIGAAEKYAKGHPEIQPSLVLMVLEQGQQGKVAAKMAARFKIPLSSVPGLELERQTASLMWAMRKQNVDMAVSIVADGLPELKQVALEWARTRCGEDSRLHQSLLQGETVVDNAEDSMEHPLLASLGRENISWVGDEEDVLRMEQVLATASVIGLDSEWKPQLTQDRAPTRCAVLQLAVAGHVWVLDMVLDMPSRDECLKRLLTSDTIVWVGFAISGDFKVLSQGHPAAGFNSVARYVDLAAIPPTQLNPQGYSGGLAGLTGLVLGKPLNKEMTMSNWEARPLREAQMVYAALDAWACCMVYEQVRLKSEELGKLLTLSLIHI